MMNRFKKGELVLDKANENIEELKEYIYEIEERKENGDQMRFA